MDGLVAPAAGIALMCFVESIAAGRAFVAKADPRLDADRELRALGSANLLGSVFQAFPASGGLSQTAVNDGAGARSTAAGAVAAVVAALVLLFLTGLFENLADATLGAVVLVAILGLLDTSTIRRIQAVRGRDAALALVTIAGVLVAGVLDGVLIAVAVSMATLMHGVNHMPIRVLHHPDALVLKPEGGLYFANARRVTDRLHALAEAEHANVVVLDASAMPDWETTAVTVLADLDDRLQELGIELRLAALNQRPLEMLGRTRLDERFAGRVFSDVAAALLGDAAAEPDQRRV